MENLVSTNRNTLETQWKIGGLIKAALNKEQEQSGYYGRGLMRSLSKDLNERYDRGFSVRSLQNRRRFHEVYELENLNPELSWTHYRVLITIDNKRKRREFEKMAIREKLSNTYDDVCSLSENRLDDEKRKTHPRA